MNWLLVFVGGGIGSLCRFAISKLIAQEHLPSFPYATFVANILSCVVLGSLMGLILRHQSDSEGLRLFWMIGFCGGFSTFSTFTNETYNLMQSGQWALALANVGFSLLVCLFALYLGIRIAT